MLQLRADYMESKASIKKRLVRLESSCQKAFLQFDWQKCGKTNAQATKDYITIQRILEKYYTACK